MQEPNREIIDKLITLFNERKYNELESYASEIIGQYPKSILVNNILGVLHNDLKNYDKAKNYFKKVIQLNPKFTDGHYNLANIYNKLNQQDKAIENYIKVIKIDKNYHKAYNNLGNIYRKKGLYQKALEQYIITLQIEPNNKRAYYNLAGVLQNFTLDKANRHINKLYLFLLKQKIIVRPIAIATNIINGLYLNTDLKNNFSLINNKSFPNNLKTIIQELKNNELLIEFMKVCPIPNYYFEKNFMIIRKEILNQIFKKIFDESYLNFTKALSAQCFLNEYVYFISEEEKLIIKKINKRINDKIKNNIKINDLEILILCCYAPLHNYLWAEKIIPSKNLSKIFKLQYKNFDDEKNQLSEIKSISNIKDNTSLKVKEQYEENPYPRWTNLGLSIEPRNIKDVVLDINLKIDLKKLKFGNNIEILIAGCGTGQHAITSASKYKNATINALDLSFNSLSYAKRKAKELGFKNINFIQGDLLDLKKINKKFDIIECVGVLHHMKDPFIGWKNLTDCLKKDSLMLIGLYSERARENISNIRKKIKNLKINTSKEDIINFRNDILEDDNSEFNDIKYSPDFYSTSGVRDLLFHVQEHRFTLPLIRKYMTKLNLNFLGFENTIVVEKFKKTYSLPNDLYDLDKWEDYEIKNNRIFSGMYQFWCKKN